jgi:hypothetical protein
MFCADFVLKYFNNFEKNISFLNWGLPEKEKNTGPVFAFISADLALSHLIFPV